MADFPPAAQVDRTGVVDTRVSGAGGPRRASAPGSRRAVPRRVLTTVPNRPDRTSRYRVVKLISKRNREYPGCRNSRYRSYVVPGGPAFHIVGPPAFPFDARRVDCRKSFVARDIEQNCHQNRTAKVEKAADEYEHGAGSVPTYQ